MLGEPINRRRARLLPKPIGHAPVFPGLRARAAGIPALQYRSIIVKYQMGGIVNIYAAGDIWPRKPNITHLRARVGHQAEKRSSAK